MRGDPDTRPFGLPTIEKDIYSYNVEQARGDSLHNLITLAMNQHGSTLQEAFDWAGEKSTELARRFVDAYEHQIPSFGETIDVQLQFYIDGLARSVWNLDHSLQGKMTY